MARIVVNELLYDPEGTDTGNEWIEIYNAGDQNINLDGWQIQKAGSAYETVFVFPSYVLRAGRFVLVGESNIVHAQFYANLAFQNGGSATDGVRIVSADETYTDTVLYDEPNTSNLIDDHGVAGVSFAPDVPSGFALARISDGWDTDDNNRDFIGEANPTPGYPNRLYCDYGISNVRAELDTGSLGVSITNYSSLTPNSSGLLEISIDTVLVETIDIAPIAGKDSLLLELSLSIPDNCNIRIKVTLANDPNPDNDIFNLQIGSTALPLVKLNEVMYDPLIGNPEWIELLVQGSQNKRNSYVIRDRAGNSFSFELANPHSSYVVLCSSLSGLILAHPECDSTVVIQTTSWAALNNDGDSIYLEDDSGVVIDSLIYVNGASPKGISLERNPVDSEFWRRCSDPLGSTIGRENSSVANPPSFHGRVYLEGSPFSPRQGEQLLIHYQSMTSETRASVSIFDLRGRKQVSLLHNELIEQSGTISWDGKSSTGTVCKRGLYILLWESQDSGGGRVWRREYSFVIKA